MAIFILVQTPTKGTVSCSYRLFVMVVKTASLYRGVFLLRAFVQLLTNKSQYKTLFTVQYRSRSHSIRETHVKQWPTGDNGRTAVLARVPPDVGKHCQFRSPLCLCAMPRRIVSSPSGLPRRIPPLSPVTWTLRLFMWKLHRGNWRAGTGRFGFVVGHYIRSIVLPNTNLPAFDVFKVLCWGPKVGGLTFCKQAHYH